MLIKSNVPKSLWAEAVNTAVFLRNRCPTRANDGMTPYELWSNRKPNVKFLRVFGCNATFLKKGPGISKFDPKGEKGILVGYSSEAKAYRLWIPGTTKIVKSRDVRFIEVVNDSKIESIDVDSLLNTNTKDELENLEEKLDPNMHEDPSDKLGVEKLTPENLKRTRGRPRLIRTGTPGRPKKQYQIASVAIESDPETVKEAIERPDKER